MSEYNMRHLSLSVFGALKNKTFLVFTDNNGRELSKKEVEFMLIGLLADGHIFMPVGDCDNFDPKEGCKGHYKPVENK